MFKCFSLRFKPHSWFPLENRVTNTAEIDFDINIISIKFFFTTKRVRSNVMVASTFLFAFFKITYIVFLLTQGKDSKLSICRNPSPPK